ncbi:MAG: hypothetical protein OXU51_07925 [Candidatus Poribacteria bacterium]|nr:hypothetical protein [Candidatus Poribacteria bacterium]
MPKSEFAHWQALAMAAADGITALPPKQARFHLPYTFDKMPVW